MEVPLVEMFGWNDWRREYQLRDRPAKPVDEVPRPFQMLESLETHERSESIKVISLDVLFNKQVKTVRGGKSKSAIIPIEANDQTTILLKYRISIVT